MSEGDLEHRKQEAGILDARKVNQNISFTFQNRVYRALWQVCWLLMARWTPPGMHAWRRILLRMFGAKIASVAYIYPSAKIWSPANLEMGAYACIGGGTTIYSMAKITLKPHALVSQGAHICAGTHDIEDAFFQLKATPVEIGARAWIAAEAFVGPGVVVGEGAVLGARGCSFRNLDPWTVYVGNPARAIKPRNIRFEDGDRE